MDKIATIDALDYGKMYSAPLDVSQNSIDPITTFGRTEFAYNSSNVADAILTGASFFPIDSQLYPCMAVVCYTGTVPRFLKKMCSGPPSEGPRQSCNSFTWVGSLQLYNSCVTFYKTPFVPVPSGGTSEPSVFNPDKDIICYMLNATKQVWPGNNQVDPYDFYTLVNVYCKDRGYPLIYPPSVYITRELKAKRIGRKNNAKFPSKSKYIEYSSTN